MPPLPILLPAVFRSTSTNLRIILNRTIDFLKKIKTLEKNRPLCDLLVSRLLIYCMVIKEGLQFANFLSQVSSLQVGASHYYETWRQYPE